MEDITVLLNMYCTKPKRSNIPNLKDRNNVFVHIECTLLKINYWFLVNILIQSQINIQTWFVSKI